MTAESSLRGSGRLPDAYLTPGTSSFAEFVGASFVTEDDGVTQLVAAAS